MTTKTGSRRLDIRKMLAMPIAYQACQALLGARGARSRFVGEHVRPRAGDRILDIGCGTAEIADFLPEQEYTGFDPSDLYIGAARTRLGGRGNLMVGSVANPPPLGGGFDVVLAMGVLHHIDDDEARELVGMARRQLQPGGRLITIDPVFTDRQGRLARFVVSKDRGQHVRTPDTYRTIAATAFATVDQKIRDDLLHIPYTHCVMECQ